MPTLQIENHGTNLFRLMTEAEAAWHRDELDLNLLRAFEAAEKAYYDALASVKAEWKALPEGDAKSSAETNAEDTEGCSDDELYWYIIALATYAAY